MTSRKNVFLNKSILKKNEITPNVGEDKFFKISKEVNTTKICCVNPKYFAFVDEECKGSIVKILDLNTKDILYVDADKEAITDVQFNPFDDNMISIASKADFNFDFFFIIAS